MNKSQIDDLVRDYPIDKKIDPDTEPWASQYDQRSADINYAMVRHFKPKVVVEFGSRAGRCTRDITRALMDNGGNYIIKSYEIGEGTRITANNNLNREFGENAPIVGGDIMVAKDIPQNVDYLFVDNYHDHETTKWVFDYLLPNHVKPGALVHFHDMCITNNYVNEGHPHDEVEMIIKMQKEGKLPLKRVYFTWEEKTGRSSTWFKYKPL